MDQNGDKVEGFPFFLPDRSFLADPLYFDIDEDGNNEIVVTTEKGEIIFLGADGIPVHGYTLKVPPIRLQKNWYSGGDNPDFQAMKKNNFIPAPQSRNLLQSETSEENFPSNQTIVPGVFRGIEGSLPPEGIRSLEVKIFIIFVLFK